MKIRAASLAAASPTRRPAVFWLSLLLLAAALALVLSGCASQPAAPAASAETLPAEVDVEQAYNLFEEGAFVLDVRTQEEWDDFHIPGTTLIPLDQLESRVGELPADEDIVVICRSGNRSQAGRDILRQAGFESVTSVDGGVTAWQSRGYPIEP